MSHRDCVSRLTQHHLRLNNCNPLKMNFNIFLRNKVIIIPKLLCILKVLHKLEFLNVSKGYIYICKRKNGYDQLS